MRVDPGHEQARLRPLAAARPLTPQERALLLALAAVGGQALTAQVQAAEVVATCDCGCPSIGLATRAADAVAPGVRIVAAHAVVGGRSVDVNLHVVDGRMEELEVWAGSFGDDPRIGLPDPGSLRPA